MAKKSTRISTTVRNAMSLFVLRILAGLEEAMASAYKSWWKQQHPDLDEESFGGNIEAFNRCVHPDDREATGAVPTKAASELRVIGQGAARIDLPDKVFGAPRFIHDLTLAGMLHGRMLRPPAPAAILPK